MTIDWDGITQTRPGKFVLDVFVFTENPIFSCWVPLILVSVWFQSVKRKRLWMCLILLCIFCFSKGFAFQRVLLFFCWIKMSKRENLLLKCVLLMVVMTLASLCCGVVEYLLNTCLTSFISFSLGRVWWLHSEAVEERQHCCKVRTFPQYNHHRMFILLMGWFLLMKDALLLTAQCEINAPENRINP